jgi:uncharacterized membrane protein SpoIIM required for sporulation
VFDTIIFSEEEGSTTEAMLATALAVVASLLIAHFILPFHVGGIDLGGLVAVFFTSLALAYPFTSYIKERDLEEITASWEEPRLLRRHAEEVELYLASFLVATFIFAAAVLALPDRFFTIQYTVLDAMNALSGTTGGTGFITADTFFLTIVTNNLGLLAATFALSFIISGGMVFVLIWNASILGVLIGATSSHVLEIPARTAPYLVHGSIEVIAYILAGLAGTLLAIDTETLMTAEKDDISHYIRPARDAAVMMSLGFLLIILAGLIEA